MKNNKNIRDLIQKNRLRHYEVAKEIGISESRFCVWLRDPLDDSKVTRVLDAIEKIVSREVE